MAIAWTSDMATGAQTLDDDHRRIVGRANDLIAAVGAGEDPGSVDRALRGLGNAALRHFGRDEDCAVRHRCPALETNGEARAEFIAILARFRVDYERNGASADVAASLEHELGSWVTRYLPGPFADRLPCLPLG